MIDLVPLWGFVLVSLVVILSPGADTMLLIRTATTGGRRPGFTTLAGIQLGNIILTTLVASGLGVVMAHNHVAMLVVQLIGGCYLVWLAITAAVGLWRLTRRRSQAAAADDEMPAGHGVRVRSGKPFLVGLVTNLTNAKLLVFYLSFLPQFLGRADNSFLQLELLAAVFIGIATGWEVALVLMAARMRVLLQRRAFAIGLEVLSAVVFAALGLGILVEALG